ncbi:MAG: flagellin [Fretibacterium sp.]|nr:flagellin [Fretibacterium sp.]
MRIFSNISALLNINTVAEKESRLSKIVKKLATGLRINSAADDAAGLAITEKMRAQVRGLDMAARNAQDGISLLQTAEGGLQEIHSMLQRMRELSVQAANDTLTAEDRRYIQLEVTELSRQINAIANQTQFNKKKILNGDMAALWSTSTNALAVVVRGPLISVDALGNVKSAAGNYRVVFNTRREGMESVQKSNIFYLKHGTRERNVGGRWLESGLVGMTALNMVEGSWNLETRETPFGGRWYYQGATPSEPAGIGAVISASPTPDILPPGSYHLRVSDRVPMMASFDAALAAGVVTDVWRSSRSSSSNFDARFDITAGAGGGTSTSHAYRDDLKGTKTMAGGNVTFGTRAANDVNLFTHYRVTGSDRRDLMAGDITLHETYVTHQATTMTVNLDYQGADNTEATLTYRTGTGNTLTATSTWRAAAGASLDLTVGSGPGATTTNVVIGGMDIDGIRAAINGAGITNVSASINPTGETRRLTITNGTADILTVTENSVGGGGLGVAGTIVSGGQRTGGPRDYNRNWNLTANGRTLDQLRASINGVNGLSASLTGTSGARQITINGDANYHVTLTATGDIQGELNLTNHTFNQAGTHATTARAHLHTVNAATQGQNLAGIITALTDVGGSGLTAAATNTGNLHGLSFTAAGMYDVRLSGTTIGELSQGVNADRSISIGRGATVETGDRVYEDYNVTIDNLGNRDAYGIATRLQEGIRAALGGDDLTNNNNAANVTVVGGGDTRNLRLESGAASGYRIRITGGTHDSLNDVWGGVTEANRGAAAVGAGDMDYGRQTDVVNVTGMNIWDARIALAAAFAGRITAEWEITPDHTTTPPQHNGQIRFTNISTGANRRRFRMIQAGTDTGDGDNANRKLFETMGPLWSNAENSGAGTHSATSNTLQAHDRVTLAVTWDGNRASNAAQVSGSGSVTLWEGTGAGTATQNATAINNRIGHNLFTDFTLRDELENEADFKNTPEVDSWMIFTQAAASGGDCIDLTLYDGLYPQAGMPDGNNGGVTTGITYAFNDGVLDGRTLALNQLVRSSATTAASLTHNMTFGTVQTANFSYGERAGAGNYWGNTGSATPWYAHSYYGGDTTYFFANGSDPTHVVTAAEVYKQSDANASLMFEYDGSQLTVRARGFDRNGGVIDTDAAPEVVPNMGDVTLAGIHFTNLQINTGLLTPGDKFVINVAAAAKLDAMNTAPSNAANFQSTANVAVSGGPFRQNRPDWGTSAQFRLANNAENGATFDLLGYFVDPFNGSSDVEGLGYYKGTIILKGEAGGFAAGSTVGAPDDAAAGSNRAVLEVNYQGDLRPSAGALVTSVYLRSMESGGSKSLKDYIGGVGYSNYRYGIRADGTYGPLNEAGSERYNPYNASLIFDVLEAYNGSLKFRVQARVVDRDGKQWYVEDNDVRLNFGANTAKNSAANPPLAPTEVLNPVTLFADSEFGGLVFDEFTLSDKGGWKAGDRFTLSLTASGFEDGSSENAQMAPGYNRIIDEIDLFSDNRGTNMPHAFRFNEGVLDNRKIDLGIYQLVNNLAKPESGHFCKDQVMDGTLSLTFGGYHPDGDLTVSNALTFDMNYRRGIDAGRAHYYSRTEDIAQFYTPDGRFILDGNSQELTIRQDDRETRVTFGGLAEIGKLAESVSDHICRNLLMQRGEYGFLGNDPQPLNFSPDLMNEKDKREIFQFVNNIPGKSQNEAVVGTFLAHSVLPGERNRLRFYGSEDLLKALGFATIQEAQDTEFIVNAFDAHNGKPVGDPMRVRAGERLYGLLEGNVALDVSGDIGLSRITYDRASGTFDTDLKAKFEHFVHLADSTAKLQIGANEGEDLMLRLGDMRVKALDLENLDLRSRESAARSITRLDNAIDRVSSQRAAIGAQINRLEHTIPQLDTASINLTAAESRIRDADMAREMMEFTKLNILVQAGMAMSLQANQLPSAVMRLFS